MGPFGVDPTGKNYLDMDELFKDPSQKPGKMYAACPCAMMANNCVLLEMNMGMPESVWCCCFGALCPIQTFALLPCLSPCLCMQHQKVEKLFDLKPSGCRACMWSHAFPVWGAAHVSRELVAHGKNPWFKNFGKNEPPTQQSMGMGTQLGKK